MRPNFHVALVKIWYAEQIEGMRLSLAKWLSSRHPVDRIFLHIGSIRHHHSGIHPAAYAELVGRVARTTQSLVAGMTRPSTQLRIFYRPTTSTHFASPSGAYAG